MLAYCSHTATNVRVCGVYTEVLRQWMSTSKTMLRLPLPPLWRNTFQLIGAWLSSGLWKHRRIDQIRANWGQEVSKEHWLATRLFDLTRGTAGDTVDDRTWADLEFERLFSSIDSTITPLGSQYLYSKMRTYRSDATELAKNYAAYQLLRHETALREQLQLSLQSLRSDSDAHICDSLFDHPPARRGLNGLVLLMSLVSISVLVAAILHPALLWLMVCVTLGNLLIVAFLHRGIHETFQITGRLGKMIAVAACLARMPSATSISQLSRLREIFSETPELRGSFRWFLADRSNDLLASIYLWLDLLFLADHVAAILVERKLRRHRDVLAQMFVQIGSLDADIAIASWLERIPLHCEPQSATQKIIELRDGFHPLIAAPIANSIDLRGQSALIVGSNMAGKTTFIKMVGTNIILGRTLGVCFASAAALPQATVMASIRAEHSIESGKSHFFAELERILSFVNQAKQGGHVVFLIDELFRGTNTPERVAAGKAVLECLGAHAQVLVTTHDVELQHLLKESFLTFHFVENPDLPAVFDYRLRPGISTAKNAITLLEKIGFPLEIVDEARRLSNDSKA